MNDPELTEAFLAEAAEHLATVEDDILALEKGEAGEETEGKVEGEAAEGETQKPEKAPAPGKGTAPEKKTAPEKSPAAKKSAEPAAAPVEKPETGGSEEGEGGE